MTLNSMTGFARTDGGDDTARWYWELRSVNGRGLDIRLRLPPGFDNLEQPARAALSSELARGNVTASLQLQTLTPAAALQLNETNLAQAIEAAAKVSAAAGGMPVSADAILATRGVLENVEQNVDSSQNDARKQALLIDLKSAIANLKKARAEEGGRLGALLSGFVDDIADLHHQALTADARSPQRIRNKLDQQIARLLDQGDIQLDPDRLHQEAMLLATKADISEELDRLGAHIAAARDLLTGGSPAGRKLDFLVQEFNREANTLCSKANHIDITRIGLQMKAAIDQFREQVQNVE